MKSITAKGSSTKKNRCPSRNFSLVGGGVGQPKSVINCVVGDENVIKDCYAENVYKITTWFDTVPYYNDEVQYTSPINVLM